MFKTIIEPSDLNTHLNDENWVVIDCRFSLGDTHAGRRAYEAGHIPGAFYAHLDEDLSGTIIPGQTGRHPLPKAEELAALFSKWGIDNQTQVVVYDDKGGAIAARLWWMLGWLGHDAVAVLNGGWPKWEQTGYAISADLSVPTPRVFTANVRSERLVDAETVAKVQNDPAQLLVDSRAPQRYRGEVEPIDPVAGHIEGAVNRPFACNFSADGGMKEPEVLRARFNDLLGDKKPEQTVFYCGSGVTACHNLLAMAHAGIGDGKLYAGSWSEWITRQ